MTRPQHHFKFRPGEPEADSLEDDAGRIAHAERVKLAEMLIDFVRRAMTAHPDPSRLADTALVRRLYQSNIRSAALARRVAELEAAADARVMETD